MVYEAQVLIGKAAQYSAKLKAIDSIETSQFPAAERSMIIDTLIGDSEIKEILVSRQHNNNIPAENEIACNRELLVPAQVCNIIHESSTLTRLKQDPNIWLPQN